MFSALVLDLDRPLDGVVNLVYSGNDETDITPDATGVACMGGRVTVEGTWVPVDHEFSTGVITHARVTSCELPIETLAVPVGPDVVLTGTLQRFWWYGSPGFGADPHDKMNFGMRVLVEGVGVGVALNLRKGDAFERSRRFAFACDGQTVTAKGDLRDRPEPKGGRTRYVLDDTVFSTACASPSIYRGLHLLPKPMPASWLD